jgi:hypothetical protein
LSRLKEESNETLPAKEAPVGVEPTVVDLQSTALATWRRRQQSKNRSMLATLSLSPGAVNGAFIGGFHAIP